MFVLHSSCCRSSLLLVGCQLSSILGRFIGRRLLSVFPPVRSASELSRGSPPNSLPPRSSRLSSSTCRATHCQSAFILSASVDSSDNRLGCLARASLRFPPLGPPVGFPSSPSRLLSPPWPSPDFSRLPRSLLFTSCTSFPSPFFVSHTITHTPSSQDLRQFYH